MHSNSTFPFDKDRLVAIAERWGTPVYIYQEAEIRKRCQTLVSLFDSTLPVSWLYAVKANDNPHLLKIIQQEGLGFDTVSLEEVLLCRKLGADPASIFYTENNMTDEEMRAAVEEGVTLNIGSLDRLGSFCEEFPGSRCCVRLKPDIGDGHHAKVDTGNKDSKFGIRMDMVAQIQQISRNQDVDIQGIHAHIGSGIRKPENLISEIKVLLNTAKKFKNLSFINFGGGIPIPYQPGEPPFDLRSFSDLASELFRSFLENENPEIRFVFEPGRWIVGSSGVLLARVTTVKDQGRVCYLGTDTGFNHLIRPVLYDAYHHVINISADQNTGPVLYDISGNICESGDVLASARKLPVSKRGDLLVFLDAGAYGMTMSSNYNRRSLPAELLVTIDGFHKVIRRRKTAQQTVIQFLKETGY